PARAPRRARRDARGPARVASPARARWVLRLPARRARGRRGGRRRARPRRRRRTRRRERRARARLRPRAPARRGVRPGGRSPGGPHPCGARLLFARITCSSPLQLDVFTQLPHAFGWLTEQRPLAAVLGTELELRLFNYRDTTPLRAGEVDDEPYGGGAGMVLRVDVVAAALEAAYGADPDRRVIALSPQGRQLDQALVEELAAAPALTLLS